MSTLHKDTLAEEKEKKGIIYGVYGWIRQIERELNLSTIIPEEINFIVIVYCRVLDCWFVGDGANEISGRKAIVNDKEPIYSLIEIDSNMIYTWKLKINFLYSVNFGIVTYTVSDYKTEDCMTRMGEYYYGFQCNWKSKRFGYNAHGSEMKHEEEWNPQQYEYISGQNLSLCFDGKKKELRYTVNCHPEKIAHRNIYGDDDTRYRLIICLGTPRDSVEMLNIFA